MAHFAKPWYRKGRGWYLEIDGKQIKLGDERTSAFDRYHQLMAGKSPSGTQVSEILDTFLDWCQRHREPRTYDWHKSRCDSFWTWLKTFNRHLMVDELAPLHLEEWLKQHPRWNPGMQRGALISIQRAFNWAVKQGRIESSPIAHIEKPSQGRRDNVIAPDMFVTMLGHVKDPAFQELLMVAWDVGCRPQEILHVEARHHEPGRWIFPKEEAKGKKRIRVVHLTPAAEVITKRRAVQYPSGPLFRNRRGKPWKKDAVNCRFCRLAKKLGRKFALADFRHSWVTRLLKAGADPISISALAGHADLSMIARVYGHAHQDPEHLIKQLMKGG